MKISRAKQIIAVFILLLLVLIPISIHHFHNHKDIHVHHDCPVYQWISTFVAIYIFFFCFIVIQEKQYIKRHETFFPLYLLTRREYNRRAPPLPYS